MSDMRRILERKGHAYHSVPVEATVAEALRVLARKRIGVVLVLQGSQLVGVFSERDAIRLAVEHGALPMDLTMREVMTTQVKAVAPETSVDECMALMGGAGIRHVPVMREGQVVGLVSMRDVIEELVAIREVLIHDLEAYIVGGDYLPARDHEARTT